MLLVFRKDAGTSMSGEPACVVLSGVSLCFSVLVRKCRGNENIRGINLMYLLLHSDSFFSPQSSCDKNWGKTYITCLYFTFTAGAVSILFAPHSGRWSHLPSGTRSHLPLAVPDLALNLGWTICCLTEMHMIIESPLSSLKAGTLSLHLYTPALTTEPATK